MTTVKATKIANCEVSISLAEVADIVRHELNAHGSRAAGVNIAIPPKTSFCVVKSEDSNKDMLCFRWQE